MRPSWKNLVLAGAGALVAASVAKHLRTPRLNLAGKVVLITGGSRGFGLALASRFGLMGCRLALCARDKDELERAAVRLRPYASQVEIFPCDLNKPDEIRAMISQVVSQIGALDGLVNNAGVIQVGPAQAMTEEDYSQALSLMFWAPFHCITEALPHFRRSGAGFIVNVASVGGKISVPHLLPYCCAKFALAGLSEGLTNELAAENIRVLTVAPGLMRTGSYIRASLRGDQRREYNWFGLSANSPGLSMDVGRAARQVVDALREGRREIVLGIPAKILVKLNGLAPDYVGAALTAASSALSSWPSSAIAARITDIAGKKAVDQYQNLEPGVLK